jgi:hypothetical protein
MRHVLGACVALGAFVHPLIAQRSMSDSVAKLSRAGRWEDAAMLSRSARNDDLAPAERCALQLGGVIALAHMGAYEIATRELRDLDAQCAKDASVERQRKELSAVRTELVLPSLPKTGLDFSGVDEFWRIADLLVKDIEPSEAQWRRLFSSVGYRLAMMNVPTTKTDLEAALRPSRSATRDSLASATDDRARRIKHLGDAVRHRAELARYRDSVTRSLPVQQAVGLAGKFLPPHGTEGVDPPLVGFALFRSDAYSLGPQGVIIDLYHVYESGGLTELLAHEFHHSYLSALSKVKQLRVDEPAGSLVAALTAMRNEGIADLIDKPHPLVASSPAMETYAKRYNEAYARTPEVIRSIDSALVIAADDSTKLRAVGSRVIQLLPSAGHFNGSYVAREIYETFGVDSLYPGVYNPFAFLRTYAAAEKKRGNPPPFSPKAVSLLDALERRYLK